MREIKPIETRYRGYRFRSRLEARWAVFFDTLGIKYEYEERDFFVDGVRYLPDFWLPELNCWMEIKGQKPTDEEWHKLKALAEYTGNDAFIASGSCWLPSEDGASILGIEGTQVYANYPAGHRDKIKTLPRDLVVVLSKIWSYGINVSISIPRREMNVGDGLYVGTSEWFSGATFDQALDDIQKQYTELKKLFAILTKRKAELFSLIPSSPLSKSSGFRFGIEGGGYITDPEWCVCKNCRNVTISEDTEFICCGDYELDEDRLMDAYTAARQARFEHGEQGRR